MPVTVACVVMTGESLDRDAAVTIAGGFSGAVVPARVGTSYVELLRRVCCAAAGSGQRGRRVKRVQQRRERRRERLCSCGSDVSRSGSGSECGRGSAHVGYSCTPTAYVGSMLTYSPAT